MRSSGYVAVVANIPEREPHINTVDAEGGVSGVCGFGCMYACTNMCLCVYVYLRRRATTEKGQISNPTARQTVSHHTNICKYASCMNL